MVSKDKLCIGLGIVAFVIFIIGFACPYWQHFKVVGVVGKFGLWQQCQDDKCYSRVDDRNPDWLKAVQAMECLALIASLLATVMLILPPIMSQMQDRKSLLYKAAAAAFVFAGICGLIGIIVFGATVKQYLHFAYAFTTIGSAGFLFVGGFATMI